MTFPETLQAEANTALGSADGSQNQSQSADDLSRIFPFNASGINIVLDLDMR
jgi:hypothetical protein